MLNLNQRLAEIVFIQRQWPSCLTMFKEIGLFWIKLYLTQLTLAWLRQIILSLTTCVDGSVT